MTASLLHVLGRSKNPRDLCCFLEVPAGSGPRPFLLQSSGSGPNHTVRAQSVATAGLQGHHPAASCAPRLPVTCRLSPRSRCSRAGPGPASQGPALLGQACPSWHTCMCHACARTPPPVRTTRPPVRAGNAGICFLCPGPPARGADSADDEGLRRGEHEFSLYLLKYLPSPFVSHLCLPAWGRSSREMEDPAGQPDTCPGLAQPRFLPTSSRSFRMLSCSLVGLTAQPWPRGGGSGGWFL